MFQLPHPGPHRHSKDQRHRPACRWGQLSGARLGDNKCNVAAAASSGTWSTVTTGNLKILGIHDPNSGAWRHRSAFFRGGTGGRLRAEDEHRLLADIN